MIRCPHCRQAHEPVTDPGLHLLTCSSCHRNFPFTVPEPSEAIPNTDQMLALPDPERDAANPAEPPVQAAAPDRTVIVPFPTPEEHEAAAHARSEDRKAPRGEPREAGGRKRTGEIRAIPATSQPRYEREEGGRKRTGELRAIPSTGRKRTVERKLEPSPDDTDPKAEPPAAPGPPVEDGYVNALKTLPSILQQSPLVSFPKGPREAPAPTAQATPPPQKEEAPPARPARTATVRPSEVRPEPPVPLEAVAATDPSQPATPEAITTQPGGPRDSLPPAVPVERTVMVKAPEAPKAAAPRRKTAAQVEAVSISTLPGAHQTDPAFASEPAQPPSTRPQSPEEVADALAQEAAIELAPGMKLGGYQLLQRIGAGGMGTVWLARQLSLDRDVAVKILRPGLAADPQFVLRFTREAFAAAQLVHHNIVQIYDCGSDKKLHFFSMEFVDSESLLSLVERTGRLEPEVAAGYVLQAARGLKFAHDRNMVHRDIKPDNLLLNHNGVVKVADLGLVKRKSPAHSAQQPGVVEEPLTKIGANPMESAMGTPAYMAPEQVENSSRVDGRADTYALGCTLYHLLTGVPPFEGDTVTMVMTMHVNDTPVPPEERVRAVPKALSQIVLKMMAKRPADRFQSMDEVIQALEEFLHIEGAAAFSPTEEHANLLERCVQEYNQSRWAKARRWAVLGFSVLTAGATILVDTKLGALPAVAVVAFFAATWVSSFVMRGLLEKGALFLRFRQFVFGAPLGTWAVWLLMLAGAGYGLYRAKLLVETAGLLGVALLCAIAFYLVVDRNVEAERQPPIREVERMLRSMRLKGLEEGALREFVCKYSLDDWEAFFEALFGYDAKVSAREKWGLNERELPRPRHAAWRDPLIRGLEAWQRLRKRRREKRQLRILERKRAKAQAQSATPARPA
jgi:serine/threonine protein kinase